MILIIFILLGILQSGVNTSKNSKEYLEIKETDNVLVIGAGPIGLFALLAAKQKCSKIAVADILSNRLELAEKYAAHSAVPQQKEKQYTCRNRICNGGCDSNALNGHFDNKHKKQIQQNIQNTGHGQIKNPHGD